MASRIVDSLLKELADIEREVEIGDHYDLRREIGLLIRAALSHAASVLDIPKLDTKAQSAKAIDVASLKAVVEAWDNDTVRAARLDLPPGIEPLLAKDDLAKAKEMLKAVEDAAKIHHPLEVAARLEFGLSRPFLRLQIELADQPCLLADLEQRLRHKAALLKPDDVRKLWADLTAEFRSDETGIGGASMPADPGVLGPAFFDPRSLADLRERLATYVARLKPLLIRKMFQSGVSSCRTRLPLAAQFLALRDVEPLTLHEQRILECLLKIYRIWGHENEDEFAGALGVTPPHWCQRATKLDDTLLRQKKAPSSADKTKLLLLATRRLLSHTDRFVAFDSPVERAVMQYKLGMEVMMPASREAVSSKGELNLQKELCKFLVERDIRAFGKSFGRSEVDLLAEIAGERILIETKLLKTVSARSIDRNVTQLIAYMDQEEPATRGVLVLYNLSDTIIVSEKRWFRQRLWILPINLCESSPSRMKKRFVIEDGGTDRLLRFIESPEDATGDGGAVELDVEPDDPSGGTLV